MQTSLTRGLLRSSLAFAAAFVFAMQVSGTAFAADTETGAGINISNTASASYTDANGNAYSTSSNTVTTVVQQSPSLTVTAGAAQAVAAGATVIDPVTLTNTGNGSGDFQVTADTSNPGTTLGYAIPGSTTCPANPVAPATFCTLAQVNTALAAISVAPGGTQVVDVVYTAPATTTSTTSTQTLSATITQAAVAASAGPPVVSALAASAPSTAVTDTAGETDTITPQARLDIQKAVTAPTTATAPIVFTLYANNGGAYDATDLASAESILNATTANTVTKPGILITDRIPTFTPTGATTPVQLALTAEPTAALAAALTGQTATVFLTTSATGTTGWVPATATNYNTSAWTYVGIYLSGSTATEAVAGVGTVPYELASKPGTSAGAVTAAQAQVTIGIDVAQPTGTGAASTTAISNIANSVIGGNPNTNGTTPVVGPGIPLGVEDGTTTAVTDIGSDAIPNTTPSTGATAPGGASNQVQTGAFTTQSVANGPLNNATATGVYPGSAATAPTNELDFTAVNATCSTTPTVTQNAGPPVTYTPSTCTHVGNIVVPGTFTNSGNASDNFTTSVTAPAGFTAQVFAATCTTGGTSNTALAGVNCVQGAALTGVSTAGGTVTSTTPLTVAQGASETYEVVYTPTAAEPAFTTLDSTVTIAGSGGSVTAPGTDSNSTHFDITPGGPIELQKTYATECGTATTFTPNGTVLPGCLLQYTVAYVDEASANSVSTANLGTEPAFAYAALSLPSTTSLVITEDGTGTTAGQTSNNWATYSGGLTAAPTSTGSVTPTYAYFTGTTGATATTTAAAATKFTASFAGPIAPGATGSVVFTVKVN